LTCVARFSVATIGFALVEAAIATATLILATTRIGHRVYGIMEMVANFENHHALGELLHAHTHLTHYHPVLRPHLPGSRPRYFEHSRRLRAELDRRNG